jgi:hypothetical protein
MQWDSRFSTGETNEFIKELCQWFIPRISDQTTRSDIAAFVSGDNFPRLLDFTVDYSSLCLEDARIVRQILAFYSKRSDLDLGIDRTQVARSTFESMERVCLVTNHVFRKHAAGDFCFHPYVEAVLFAAQRKIAFVLGDLPTLEDFHPRFGPGATTTITRRKANALRKLSEGFFCSEDLLPIIGKCLEEVPAWIPFGDAESVKVPVEIHPGYLRFVPKDAKTDRAIVVEPILNSFFQIGIGDYIADRLRIVDQDVRDQTRNQRLALLGSSNGELATLDLSSASDCIARELVAHLLPVDWYLFLSHFRTSTIIVEGEPVKLQKFSSMGNGFTFPLETLIFWALSKSVSELSADGRCSTYGDDIIVPSACFERLTYVLGCVGFLPNKKKSFHTGPFRESCGTDYYSGINIRPFYLRDRMTGEIAFMLHNFFVRHDLFEPSQIVLKFIDPEMRIYGPDGFGDGHLLGDWYPTPHRRKVSDNPRISSGWGGYTFETYSWKGRKEYRLFKGDYVYPAYSIYVRDIPFVDPIHDILSRSHQLAGMLFGVDSIRSFADSLSRLSTRTIEYGKSGCIGVDLPGTRKYRRMKIYTF